MVLYASVVALQFFELVPTLFVSSVVAVCGQELSDLLKHFLIPRRRIKLSLDPLLGYQLEECLYFLNRQRNSNFLVDTKRCVCSNKSCVQSFAGCADLNLASLLLGLVSQVQ